MPMPHETSFQLDMTAFYSADLAMSVLNSGYTFHGSKIQPDLSYLAVIIAASLLFDVIYVPLPTILDIGRVRNEFGAEASKLVHELTKHPAIVKPLNIDEEDKEAMRTNLEDCRILYRECTTDFFRSIEQHEAEALAMWARNQLENHSIVANTSSEEKQSDFHSIWTQQLTTDVVTELGKSSSIVINSFDDNIKNYIVRTGIRGFIYKASGNSTYLPHYVREGLLEHAQDPTSLPSIVSQLAGLNVVDSAGNGISFNGRLTHMRVVPLLTASIFNAFSTRKMWDAKALADELRDARTSEENQLLRKRLRETVSDEERSQIIEKWTRKLLRDTKVQRGEVLPTLFDLIPKSLGIVKLIDATQTEKFLEYVAKILPDNSPIISGLRSPLYASKHLRYLWKCTNGKRKYIGSSLLIDGDKQKLLPP